ncbi:MAG: response regulator transcription factor [Nitrospira sp.]
MNPIEDTTTTTVVAIVSTNYLLRLGLQRIVEAEKWIRLIGQTVHGAHIDAILAIERPDVVIIDTESGAAVADLIQQIKAAATGVKTILLSGFDDVECTRQAFQSGVDSIVLKVQPSAVLLATIAHLARSSQEVASTLGGKSALPVAPFQKDPPSLSPRTPSLTKQPDGLTERECEVVRLISEGLSNKDIANRLCISSITVRHHLTSIFDKLGVSNRQKLLIRAHQNGLSRPPALA